MSPSNQAAYLTLPVARGRGQTCIVPLIFGLREKLSSETLQNLVAGRERSLQLSERHAPSKQIISTQQRIRGPTCRLPRLCGFRVPR